MPCSFHSHSGQFCQHGNGTLIELIHAAIAQGFPVYGFSEHQPRLFPGDLYPEEQKLNWTPGDLLSQYQRYHQQARHLQQKYQSQIHLLVGMETEWIHIDTCDYDANDGHDMNACNKKKEQELAFLHQLLINYPVDYLVGSLHHVCGGIPFDFSLDEYKKAYYEKCQGSMSRLQSCYYDAQYDMLRTLKPRIVGHFDLIRIYEREVMRSGSGMKEGDGVETNCHDGSNSTCKTTNNHHHDMDWFMDDQVWDKIVRNVKFVVGYGGLFEINSRAWKKGLMGAYPQGDIVQLIQREGGRFTLGDDSHAPQEVGLFYREKLWDYLRQYGIDRIYYLKRRIDAKEGEGVEGEKDRMVDGCEDGVEVHYWDNILEHPFWRRNGPALV